MQKIEADTFPVIGSTAPEAFYLGRHVVLKTNTLRGRMCFGGETHGIIFGPNGSGKTTRLLIPNLLRLAGRSVVVVDPKGELAGVTAPYRRTLGPVYIVNPFGIHIKKNGYEDLKSCGYNPLASLDPESPSFNSDVALLADALVTVQGKDPHFDNSARALLAAIIMFVVMEAHQKLTPEMEALAADQVPFLQTPTMPTMARVRELIGLASDEAAARNGFKGAGIPALALAMMKSKLAGLRNKAAQFTEWTNEIRSIASTAKIQTEPFDDNEIAEDLSKDGFRFDELRQRPTTIYLVLPPGHMERHSKWLRLMLTDALRCLTKEPEPGQTNTLLILEEAAALGHLKILETVWALVRGYGVQIVPVFQDLGQIKSIYEKRWRTFIANAGFILSFAVGDDETADFLAKRAGFRTSVIVSSSTNTSTTNGSSSNNNIPSIFGPSGTNYSTTKSTSENSAPTKTETIHALSLYGLKPGATINFFMGVKNYIAGYAPPYWNIELCKVRARENPSRLKPLPEPEKDKAPDTLPLMLPAR